MLCLYSCWTALLTVSAHETGKHIATEGGKSNTEALHSLPGGRHTLVLQADLGSQQSSQKAVRLALQHLALYKSQVRRKYHQTCDVDECWGDDDLARLTQQLPRMPRTRSVHMHGFFWPKK